MSGDILDVPDLRLERRRWCGHGVSRSAGAVPFAVARATPGTDNRI